MHRQFSVYHTSLNQLQRETRDDVWCRGAILYFVQYWEHMLHKIKRRPTIFVMIYSTNSATQYFGNKLFSAYV